MQKLAAMEGSDESASSTMGQDATSELLDALFSIEDQKLKSILVSWVSAVPLDHEGQQGPNVPLTFFLFPSQSCRIAAGSQECRRE